jgi:hypothetical protein
MTSPAALFYGNLNKDITLETIYEDLPSVSADVPSRLRIRFSNLRIFLKRRPRSLSRESSLLFGIFYFYFLFIYLFIFFFYYYLV